MLEGDAFTFFVTAEVLLETVDARRRGALLAESVILACNLDFSAGAEHGHRGACEKEDLGIQIYHDANVLFFRFKIWFMLYNADKNRFF